MEVLQLNYPQFQQTHQNRKIDWDHLGEHKPEDVALQYLSDCFDLRNEVLRNPLDFWQRPSDSILSKFNRIGGYDVVQGDIVVTTSNEEYPEGRIGIANGLKDGPWVQLLMQEETVHLVDVSTADIAGILRPIEPPAPSPEVPVVPEPVLPELAPVINVYNYDHMTAPKVAPRRDFYEVLVEVDAYISARNAKLGQHPDHKMEPGKYHIFTERDGIINLTKVAGQPGRWIRLADNVLPPPVLPPEPPKLPDLDEIRKGWSDQDDDVDYIETPTKKTHSPESKPNWHTTYRPFVDINTGEQAPVMYAAICNAPVVDLEGRHRDSYVHSGDLILIAGTVEYNGVIYGRASQAADKLWWHSIDMDFVDLEENVYGYDNRSKWWQDVGFLIAGRVKRYKDNKANKEPKNV